MKKIVILLPLLFVFSSVFAETETKKKFDYSIPYSFRESKGKIILYEIGGGLIGPTLLAKNLTDNIWLGMSMAIAGYAIFPVTVPYGVYEIGKTYQEGGSFWITFMGAQIAAFLYSNIDRDASFGELYLSSIIGAVAGYNIHQSDKNVIIESKSDDNREIKITFAITALRF